MEAKVVNTESVNIEGIEVEVQTVEINKQQFRIAPLTMGQVRRILKPDPTAEGFDRSWRTIADSINDALPANQRKDPAVVMADLEERMRLPEHNALHGAILSLSGLKAAEPGEKQAATA